MSITTQNLIIIPLSKEQLVNYTYSDFSLEKSLQVNLVPRILSDYLTNVIKSRVLPHLDDTTKNPLFRTFWTIIYKRDNVMVADICFKGEPNEQGEIEIGYGTYTNFEGKGFMTEAVGGMITWAFEQPKVTSIIAQTDPLNIASQKILQKNNFHRFNQTPENILWRIDK